MTEDVIAAEAAEEELRRIIDFWEVDPEGEAWEDAKPRLLFAMRKGRITLDEEAEVVKLGLVKPIEKENGETICELNLREPSGGDLEVLDKHKETETMGKMLHLVSRMSGQPLGVIKRMASRDISTLASLASLFF